VATAGAGTVVEEVEEAEDVDVLVARRRGARGLAAAAALMKRRGLAHVKGAVVVVVVAEVAWCVLSRFLQRI
jgi:hypothetical protein